MASVSRTYETRHKRKSSETPTKSRVDWKRTKVDTVSHILDSEETTTSEEEEEDESDPEDSGSSSTTQGEEQQPKLSQEPADDGEDSIKTPRRKSRSAMIGSSDSSSDSDEPGTRVGVRRCRVLDEDEEGLNRPPVDEETKAQLKKQKRKENLKQLAERRRSRNQRTSQESHEGGSSGEDTPLTPEDDSQDMKDFIVEDEEEAEEDEEGNRPARYRELFLKHNLSQFASNDLYSHLQKVIKAFLINIADKSFLVTLYDGERQKRYAKDMLKSLNYLDERVIAPRLEKLTTSCRWKKRYQERVDCYPEILVRVIKAEEQSCDACELYRYCKYTVTLSGLAYDNATLENDDFLPEDKQYLAVGSTCAARTKVYHRIKHYKYWLYQRCVPYLPESKDHTAKEAVEMALSQMEEDKFIKQEVRYLDRIVNEADTFREEDSESLLS